MPTVVPLPLGWMANEASVLVTGASGTMRYPIPGYAVVHERGTLVFDTGLHDTLMDSTAELGGLAKVFTVELSRDDLVEARLAEHGIDPAEITHVVNSHLHFDHCGRNGPFAHATTLVQAAEWEAAQRPGRTTYVGVHLDEVAAGHVELLSGAHDVFGDGTVVCVPTPGHTAGHQSLLVRAADRPGAESVLLVGDACYLHSMLTDGVLPPFAHDADRQRATYDLLAEYQRQGTRLLFSHDVAHWDAVPETLTPPRRRPPGRASSSREPSPPSG
jgi:glyoxylase-like metal-dependent hydrolase (beta-lactamase superfamily II)